MISIDIHRIQKDCLTVSDGEDGLVKSIPIRYLKCHIKIEATISQECIYISSYFGLHRSVKGSKLKYKKSRD